MKAARPFLARLHRYAGLSLALFLVLAGVSGSLIVFYEELDIWLNPELLTSRTEGLRLSPDRLAKEVERGLPGTRVTLMELTPPGRSAELWLKPTGQEPLGYDQVFADPVTGRVLGKRQWGEAELSRAALMPLLYAFHYTLKLPGVWGTWLMGLMACLWTIDCLVAFALTLPRRAPFWSKWKTAWRIKRGAGPYRFHFDLHRAGGLWLWAVLLVMATSGVALNLPDQVFRPVVGLLADLSPSFEEIETARLREKPRRADLTYDDALARAKTEAGGEIVPRYLFHVAEAGLYGAGYGPPDREGVDGLGLSWIYFDDRTGAVVGHEIAGKGKPADVYVRAQYQLHSGRILGWPGRIFVSLLGLAVAGLSVTGVFIWLKKARARGWTA